ncbi:MAG: hypothetical protein JOZ62_07980 [Acidobacteriaceae bacterium]|nr:hypothetical protein [Acidobacteriaceae bacterium]
MEIPNFPAFAPAGFMNIGNAAFQHTSYNSYNLLFSNTKTSGPHVLRFGFEGRMLRHSIETPQSPDGNFSFPVSLTQGPDPTKASPTGGSGLASMLLGLGSGTMIQNNKVFSTQSFYYAWYFGDDWKINSRLTLNLGVRYEIQVPRPERHNRMNYFDPNVASPLAGPAGIPGLKGGLIFVGVNGAGRRQFPTIWSNVAPRLGFACQLNSKTIMRGGGGIFYLPAATASTDVIGNFGYATTTSFVGSQDGLTPYAYLSNPFPTGLTPITGNSQGLLTGIGQAITEPLRTATVPYTENWSLGMQRELPGSILLDAAYVGNHSVNLLAGAEANLNLNQLAPQQMALGPAVLQPVPNPFFGLITTGALSSRTVPKYYLLRSFPQFISVGLLYPQGSDSFYNALQLKVEKRLSHGLNFLLSYAKQKLIDDNSINENLGQNAASQNYYCRKCDRSVSANDISQRFVYSAVYELPFGRGRRFGNGWNALIDAALGGWQANGILTFQTGFPLSVLNGTDTTLGSASAGEQSLRPNNNGQSAKLSGPIEQRLNRYFNTSVFSPAVPSTFGDTGRTLPDVRGPGIRNLDFSLFKNFRIKERVTAEFRGEAFNFTNTVQFGLPNTTLNSNQLSVISTQTNSPRQMQVGLKLLW